MAELATADLAKAAVESLRAQAAYHKAQREYHRRQCRDLNSQAEELRKNCEAVGIIFEPEAISHGHASTAP